jgi:ribosome-associated translation inhibitor RaiA
MIQVIFKNLEHSELIQETAVDRFIKLTNKFPDLNRSRVFVTVERHNSQFQAGPDEYSVSVHVSGGRYKGVRLTQTASNVYVALAEVLSHMLERLNRFGDRERVTHRDNERRSFFSRLL